MHTKTIVDILSDLTVFRGLTGEDVARFAEKSRNVSFQEKDILIEEGTTESVIYILIKGRLKVFLPKKVKGKMEHRISQVLLNVLMEGDCFGEYSLIDHKPTSASVMAAGPVELIKIQGADFHDILHRNDRIARVVYENMLRLLVQRLRRKDRELDLIRVIG